MKKTILVALAFFLVTTTSSYALILENGGFEDGDFSGWDLDYGQVQTGQNIIWGQTDPGSEYHQIFDVNTARPLNQIYDIDPYYQNYMAKINTGGGDFNATKLTQVGTIEQSDIDEDANLYYTWGAAMVEPTNDAHGDHNDFPFFGVDITVFNDVDGIIDERSYRADATHAKDPDSEWLMISDGEVMWPGIGSEYPGFLYYLQGEWDFDLGVYSAGDQIKIELIAADCGLGGHGGYAFIDGIGTEQLDPPPPPVIPEPSIVALLGFGLVGLVRMRKKIIR